MLIPLFLFCFSVCLSVLLRVCREVLFNFAFLLFVCYCFFFFYFLFFGGGGGDVVFVWLLFVCLFDYACFCLLVFAKKDDMRSKLLQQRHGRQTHFSFMLFYLDSVHIADFFHIKMYPVSPSFLFFSYSNLFVQLIRTEAATLRLSVTPHTK